MNMNKREMRATCTICNRFADKTIIADDHVHNLMQVTVECHGQRWHDTIPIRDVYSSEYTKIIVPPITKQLT